MAKVGEAFIDIRARLTKLKSDLNKAHGIFKKKMQQMGSAAKAFALSVQSAMRAARTAILALAAAIGGVLYLTVKQEEAEAKLAAAMKASGFAAGFTTKEMMKLAMAYREVTAKGEEEIMTAMAVLSTFVNIRGPQFIEAMDVLFDLANLFGGDLQTNAVRLGMALNAPAEGLTRLTRAGVSFSEQEKKTVKEMVAMNKVAEAQMFMLRLVKEQGVEGLARSYAETLGGKLSLIKEYLEDIVQAFGEVVTAGAPWDEMMLNLKVAGDWIKDNGDTVRDIVWEIGEAAVEFGTAIWELVKSLGEMLSKLDELTGHPALGIIKAIGDFYGQGGGFGMSPMQDPTLGRGDGGTIDPLSLSPEDFAALMEGTYVPPEQVGVMDKFRGAMDDIRDSADAYIETMRKKEVADNASAIAELKRSAALDDLNKASAPFNEVSKGIAERFMKATGQDELLKQWQLNEWLSEQWKAIDEYEDRLLAAGQMTGDWTDKLKELRQALLATAEAEKKGIVGTNQMRTVAASYQQRVSGVVGDVSVDNRFSNQGMKQASTERTAMGMLSVLIQIKDLIEDQKTTDAAASYG